MITTGGTQADPAFLRKRCQTVRRNSLRLPPSQKYLAHLPGRRAAPSAHPPAGRPTVTPSVGRATILVQSGSAGGCTGDGRRSGQASRRDDAKQHDGRRSVCASTLSDRSLEDGLLLVDADVDRIGRTVSALGRRVARGVHREPSAVWAEQVVEAAEHSSARTGYNAGRALRAGQQTRRAAAGGKSRRSGGGGGPSRTSKTKSRTEQQGERQQQGGAAAARGRGGSTGQRRQQGAALHLWSGKPTQPQCPPLPSCGCSAVMSAAYWWNLVSSAGAACYQVRGGAACYQRVAYAQASCLLRASSRDVCRLKHWSTCTAAAIAPQQQPAAARQHIVARMHARALFLGQWEYRVLEKAIIVLIIVGFRKALSSSPHHSW